MKKAFDLLVVGGGILGTFHAYHAARMGQSVLLVERDAAPQGATVRNFGQVVPSGLNRQWQQYGRESLRIYKEIQSKFDISVRQLGSLYIASDDEELTLLEELASINQDTGYASTLWTRQQCREHCPSLKTDYCVGGLYFPSEVSVNPRQMIHRLHEYLADMPKVCIRHATTAVELSRNANGLAKLVTGEGLTFEAKYAVVCSGSDFQTLFPDHFAKSRLQSVKLQMTRLAPLADVCLPGNLLTGKSIRRYESFSECPSWSKVKAAEATDSFWKRWGVHILFKQESDGSIILGDSHEYQVVGDDRGFDYETRREITDFFIEEGRNILDLPNWKVESEWYGIYSQTDDPSGIHAKMIEENIEVVTGIGGKGMTSSAGFAKDRIEKLFVRPKQTPTSSQRQQS